MHADSPFCSAGGILAGWLSDRLKMRGIVSVTFLLLTVPGLYIYSVLADRGDVSNGILMVIVGILVNGARVTDTPA